MSKQPVTPGDLVVSFPSRSHSAECYAGDRETVETDDVLVFVLDDTQDGGRGRDGNGLGAGGGHDDHEPNGEQSSSASLLSDERRDQVIVMIIASLSVIIVLLIGGVMLAGAAGWIKPACAGMLVTRTATCGHTSDSYRTLTGGLPDAGSYRLDLPVHTTPQP
ncbi:MAG: hypothetical protein RMN25_06630 [Anaerolineae bacterium]|nr:hypothetical protein [Thermoflexales bacterium]MDW8407445.1 hypothetical protein [Anaerolineae bacterium]